MRGIWGVLFGAGVGGTVGYFIGKEFGGQKTTIVPVPVIADPHSLPSSESSTGSTLTASDEALLRRVAELQRVKEGF